MRSSTTAASSPTLTVNSAHASYLESASLSRNAGGEGAAREVVAVDVAGAATCADDGILSAPVLADTVAAGCEPAASCSR